MWSGDTDHGSIRKWFEPPLRREPRSCVESLREGGIWRTGVAVSWEFHNQ